MPTITIYDPGTGRIMRTVSASEEDCLLNIEDGEVAIEGAHNCRTHYVLEGQAIPFPEAPGDWAVWDWAAQGWTDPRDEAWHAARLAELWDETRAERDRRLLASDRYALPDYPHTEAERAAWLAYRQALRDLPEATSDPERPDWPVPPVI